ncbi:MAG: ABC transporter permease [Thermomicrobiales bacterium]
MLVRTTLRSLPGRKGNVAGTFVAIVLAVAVMFGAISVLVSTQKGPAGADRLAGVPIMVEVDRAKMLGLIDEVVVTTETVPLSADQVAAISMVEGVASVVPDVTFPAQLLDANGVPIAVSETAQPVGASWTTAVLTPFTIAEGRAPQADNEVVLDRQSAAKAGLSVGDEVRIVSDATTDTYRVVGIAQPGDRDGLLRQSTIFFTAVRAAVLSGGRGADRVAVFPEPGVSPREVAGQIRTSLAGQPLKVLTGRSIAKVDTSAGARDVSDFGEIMGVMASFVGFVAIFVLVSTIGFSIRQRERELGIQRAIGYTPKQVRNAIMVETLALAIVASGVGLLLGTVMARVFVQIAIAWGKLPSGFPVFISGIAALIVASSALGIAMMAAWLAGRRTSRIRPIEALRSAAAPSTRIGVRRLVTGLVCVAGGLALVPSAVVLPTAAGVSMSLAIIACLTIGIAVLGPFVVAPMARLIGRAIQRGSDVTAEVATSNSRRMAARVASAITPIVLGVGFMALMFNFTATLEEATVVLSREREQADLYAVPSGAALPADTAERIAAIEGVKVAWPMQTLDVAHVVSDSADGLTAMAVDPTQVGQVEAIDVEKGSLADLRPGTVIVSGDGDLPTRIGGEIRLQLPDGSMRTLTVAGVARNLTGLADLLITPGDAGNPANWHSIGVIAIDLAPGADPGAVQEAVTALGQEGYPLQVVDKPQYVSGIRQTMQTDTWATYLIVGAAAVFGLIAAINTIAMSTSERRREFALMRLIGSTPAQVKRMLAWEATIVSTIGVLLGWLVAVISTGPVSLGIVGTLAALSVSPLAMLAAGTVAVVAVFATFGLSAAAALRFSAVEEIGRRE